MKPRLLDLFCGAGGASMGYYRAGFAVYGIDNKPQPHYPFPFLLMDALEAMDRLLRGEGLTFSNGKTLYLADFDAFHASPPCQGYIFATKKYRNKGKVYPLLVKPMRQRLLEASRPYIIENCVGSPLINPIRLCGVMFNLQVIRHRLFESNIGIPEPVHRKHNIALYDGSACAVWTGGYNPGGWGNPELKKRLKSQYYTVVGHGGNSPDYRLESWRKAMGIDWMTKEELVEAIPPAYTEYIGKYLLEVITQEQVKQRQGYIKSKYEGKE